MQISAGTGRLPKWGVLVYSSASPDIEPACRAAFDDVIHARAADGIGIAAQLGTAREVRRVCVPASEGTADGGARAAGRSERTSLISSAGATDQSLPAADMSSPETLEAFLRWGMKAVPAERYVVVLGGHGSGFMGAVTDSTRQRIMHPQDMRAALASAGLHADVLVLNACLEANAEVALEVAPQADFLVASQGLQEGLGMPLGAGIERVRADSRPAEVARIMVEASRGVPERTPLLSALDEQRMGAVAAALDVLGRALLATPGALGVAREEFAAMRNYREDKPWDRPLVDLKDVRDMAHRLSARLPGSAVAQAAAAVDRATGEAVLASSGDGGGLSAYLPTQPLHVDVAQRQYDSLALASAGGWHEALRRIAAG